MMLLVMMINDMIIDKEKHLKGFYAEEKSDYREKREVQFRHAYCYMQNCTQISMVQHSIFFRTLALSVGVKAPSQQIYRPPLQMHVCSRKLGGMEAFKWFFIYEGLSSKLGCQF